MSGAWWSRMAIVILSIAWGIWMLIPTFIGETAEERNAKAAASLGAASGDEAAVEQAAEDLPWYWTLLPNKRLQLGLDLQGGIDLTLQVEVDEAVLSAVQRDINPLKQSAENEGLKIGDVRRARGEPALLIEATPDIDIGSLTAFMTKQFQDYEYANTREVDGRTFHAFRITEAQADYIRKRAVEQSLETLRNRIDETGVKEPSILLKGGDRINIQLPGVEDPQTAIDVIDTSAVLEFMLVDEEAMKNSGDLARALLAAEQSVDPVVYNDDPALSDYLRGQGAIPENTVLMWEYVKDPATNKDVRKPDGFYVLKDEVILTGDDINDASVSIDQYNQPYTAMEFKPRGAKIFADVTAENVGRRFAIVLDKKVSSAPNIREKISGGRASIESGVGDYNMALQEASVLSLVLRTGALPAPVTIGQISTVGPSLGEDAIRSGTQATLVGSGLIIAFMLVYYKLSGMVATIALMANVLLVFSLLAGAGATLTLPGITGITLTIAMAVDCNIIIYERIKEELRLGKNGRAAVGMGFDRGTLAVLDANVTNFIAGVVLYTYGSGPIKGFAVTMMIGIITTVFTGVFMTRVLMDFLTRKASGRLSI